jgi:hypothetical protein
MTTLNAPDTRGAHNGLSHSPLRAVREAWRRPLLKVLPAENSETGVNSDTDLNNTFS